jgi:CBS domain-containing protein
MVSNCVSALLVIDIYAKLVGIVSKGDLIRRVEIGTERRRSGEGETLMSSDALAKEFVKSRAKRVSDVMTREVITAQPETPLREIANLMEKHSIKRVPIVRDELVVGIRRRWWRVSRWRSDRGSHAKADNRCDAAGIAMIRRQRWQTRYLTKSGR